MFLGGAVLRGAVIAIAIAGESKGWWQWVRESRMERKDERGVRGIEGEGGESVDSLEDVGGYSNQMHHGKPKDGHMRSRYIQYIIWLPTVI